MSWLSVNFFLSASWYMAQLIVPAGSIGIYAAYLTRSLMASSKASDPVSWFGFRLAMASLILYHVLFLLFSLADTLSGR